MKAIFFLAVLLAAAYFGLDFAGYKPAFQNFQYYLPQKTNAAEQQNVFAQYLNQVQAQNRTHPLIVRKNGTSQAAALDQSSTKLLKDLLQVDKFGQLDKAKKDIAGISAKADERDRIIEEASK